MMHAIIKNIFIQYIILHHLRYYSEKKEENIKNKKFINPYHYRLLKSLVSVTLAIFRLIDVNSNSPLESNLQHSRTY